MQQCKIARQLDQLPQLLVADAAVQREDHVDLRQHLGG
jgi:hypothetical protein